MVATALCTEVKAKEEIGEVGVGGINKSVWEGKMEGGGGGGGRMKGGLLAMFTMLTAWAIIPSFQKKCQYSF